MTNRDPINDAMRKAGDWLRRKVERQLWRQLYRRRKPHPKDSAK